MRDEYMTDLDRLGMYLAARAGFEKRFGFSRKRRVGGKTTALESLEDLLKRDADRAKDGFPKKIKFRRILAGSGKVIVVPYVEEEQLTHGDFEPKRIVQMVQFLDEEDDGDIEETTGHGEGKVGDVIGEVPLPLDGGGGDDGGGDQGPGAGDESGDHAFEEKAYEIGKRLMEQLQLPNLKDKKKKVPTDEYTYDLTDRHRGSGQVHE